MVSAVVGAVVGAEPGGRQTTRSSDGRNSRRRWVGAVADEVTSLMAAAVPYCAAVVQRMQGEGSRAARDMCGESINVPEHCHLLSFVVNVSFVVSCARALSFLVSSPCERVVASPTTIV